MIDRKEVMSWLEGLAQDDWSEWHSDSEVQTTAQAALELLKEQEAVKPIKKDAVVIKVRYEFDCPCGAPLLIGQPYCADCGKEVKWDE